MSWPAELRVQIPAHTSKGRPTLRSIHQFTWPKRPAAYVLCHLLCPMVPPDKLFMGSHLKPRSDLMRSTFLVSVQFLLLVTPLHHLKATRRSSGVWQLFKDVALHLLLRLRVHVCKRELFNSFVFWSILSQQKLRTSLI